MNAHPRTEFAELMERAGLCIETAAEMLDVSDRTIRRNINGEGKRIDQLRLARLREAADSRCTGQRPEGFRFIDLFAGIGGLPEGPQGPLHNRRITGSRIDRSCR